MENLTKQEFEEWMERVMERFDMLQDDLKKHNKEKNMLDGQRLLDNQDLCFLLKISKRTLQRYRSERKLPYTLFGKKIYYTEKDTLIFIKTYLDEAQKIDAVEKTDEDIEDEDPENRESNL